MRLLMRGGILALFGVGAVVAMTILFSAQIRFDQAAELQIRGHSTSRAATTVVTATHSLFADSGEARASPGDKLSARGEEEVSREAAVSSKPLAGPPPKADSRFTSVRVNRPGAEPTVYRVPKER